MKPFLTQAKKSLTVPSFSALDVLFPDFHILGYVKQHNIALPLHALGCEKEAYK